MRGFVLVLAAALSLACLDCAASAQSGDRPGTLEIPGAVIGGAAQVVALDFEATAAEPVLHKRHLVWWAGELAVG